MKKHSFSRHYADSSTKSGEKGFSLIEATIALVVLLIVMLGVFSVFVFAVQLNSANSSRSKTLSVLEIEEENMRSAKFTSNIIDANLLGGVQAPRTVTNGNKEYLVEITIDDDPFTAGVQVDVDKTLKEITLTVIEINSSQGTRISMPATLQFRRVRAN